MVPKRTLKPGQEVLARWSDDGWYYRGVVVKGGADEKYIVRDATGYTESIFLEDILLDSDNEFQVVQVILLILFISFAIRKGTYAFNVSFYEVLYQTKW